MYICICNGVTEKHVREAVASGVSSVAAVYRSRDCRPQCGRCIPHVRDLLRGEAAAADCHATR